MLGSGKIPVILGCSSTVLTGEEIRFFSKYKPLGYILFSRNIDNLAQLKQLVLSLKAISGKDTPILIDQEGGRVVRLKPPHWPKFESMEYIVNNYPDNMLHAIYQNALNIAKELNKLAINVNCAPVCDLKIEGSHAIVGDRSFGSDPDLVAKCANVMCAGLRAGGVLPILKHIPGHGRAMVDSHESLPIINEPLDVLEKTDFRVFKLLNNENAWAMTAHIIYSCLDKNNPATLSSKVIKYIREQIGFKGIIISDDISMKALSGDLGEIGNLALNAGCDIVLHCNGNMDEMVNLLSKISSRQNS